jgi:glycerol-3-phosphate dehydrogenase (NAD(P)+)
VKVTVVGAGAWGTALGLLLSKNGHQVTLWGHHPENLREMQRRRENQTYLPGVPLPEWNYSSVLPAALEKAEAAVIAVPSKAFREIASQFGSFRGLLVTVTKGVEFETGLTMSSVLKECASHARIAALSGPTLAIEVARGFPAAIVAAGETADVAQTVQELFHRPSFRVYTSTDLIGVELGGALKNVIAIGAGIGDGLGFGDNSKAAIVTRAITEMRRLGIACGAQAETFSGLSGLGDLMVTCFSKHSRNRTLGERLGRGEKLHDILESSSSVAEGVPTARAAYRLARKVNVETPIIDEVHAMLYEGKNFSDSLRDLTARTSKAENA